MLFTLFSVIDVIGGVAIVLGLEPPLSYLGWLLLVKGLYSLMITLKS